MPSVLENELARTLPMGTSTEEGTRTARRVLVPYDYDSQRAIRSAYRGYSEVADDGTIRRFHPYKDPDDEEQRVVAAHFQGLGYGSRVDAADPMVPMTTAIKPKYWIFGLQFDYLDYDLGNVASVDGDLILGETPSDGDETKRYCSKTIREGSERIVPPVGQVQLDVDGRRVQLSIPTPILLPFSEVEVIWHQVPGGAFPAAAIDQCVGRVNSVAMKICPRPDGISSHAPGTMQFLGARPMLTRSPFGSFCYQIHYFFKRRGDDYAPTPLGISWQSLPDSKGIWRTAYKVGTTDKLNAEADLNTLFQSAALP